MSNDPDATVLEVTDLVTRFCSERGTVNAVRGVSLSLERGRTLGVVGESGSGKSVLSRSIMGLMPGNASRTGSVRFQGEEILNLPSSELRRYWGQKMAMVFQDPMTALNPVLRIERQITESLHEHIDMSKTQARETALALFQRQGRGIAATPAGLELAAQREEAMRQWDRLDSVVFAAPIFFHVVRYAWTP